MGKKKLQTLTGLMLCLFLLLGQVSAALSFTSLARGQQSGIHKPFVALITNKADWAEYWRHHAAIFHPTPPPPPVDFDRASLIAIHLGERRTGGYSLQILAVDERGGELVVSAVEHRPGPGTIVTQALTQPYEIIRIPRVEPGTRLRVEWN